MSLQKQQNFLARLYTDAELRRVFLFEPEKIGAENDLDKAEIADIAAILPDEINFFADSLFWKRLRESEKFLPLTRAVLGEDFITLFREFSQNFNPQTVKKHLEDAIGFCLFLQKSEVTEIVRNIAEFEKTKSEFFGFGKGFAFCRLNYKIEEISREGAKTQRKTNYFWLRIGKKIKHFSY